MVQTIPIAVLALVASMGPVPPGAVPLRQAHAHNDYLHDPPLLAAGVDLINTDDLKGFQEFLLQHGR